MYMRVLWSVDGSQLSPVSQIFRPHPEPRLQMIKKQVFPIMDPLCRELTVSRHGSWGYDKKVGNGCEVRYPTSEEL